MDAGLTGKTVVVTGVALGIGPELCVGLAANGADVIGVDIRDMSPTGRRVEELGGRWTGIAIDLENPDSVATGCREILGQAPAVDALVNNAAIVTGLKMTPFDALDLDEWDRCMRVNVRGTYLMVRELLPGLKAGKGKIVNFASGSVLRGSPGLMHYVASKGAIIAMTRSMATELGGFGINVNAVAPGFVTTDSSKSLSDKYEEYLAMTVAGQSIKTPLNATDMVGTVLYLCSNWSDAVTGQLCAVDYGLNKH